MQIQFIEDIKHKIGKYVFHRDLKQNKRQKSVYNLEEAKSIGILFEATNKDQIKEQGIRLAKLLIVRLE